MAGRVVGQVLDAVVGVARDDGVLAFGCGRAVRGHIGLVQRFAVPRPARDVVLQQHLFIVDPGLGGAEDAVGHGQRVAAAGGEGRVEGDPVNPRDAVGRVGAVAVVLRHLRLEDGVDQAGLLGIHAPERQASHAEDPEVLVVLRNVLQRDVDLKGGLVNRDVAQVSRQPCHGAEDIAVQVWISSVVVEQYT